MKSLITLLILTVSFSAQALTVECRSYNNGVDVTAKAEVVSTTENDMAITHQLSGELELSLDDSSEVLPGKGELVIWKKGKYYKDVEVHNFHFSGNTNTRRAYVLTSDDPALRTDQQKNRVIVDGVDQGTFSCTSRE